MFLGACVAQPQASPRPTASGLQVQLPVPAAGHLQGCHQMGLSAVGLSTPLAGSNSEVATPCLLGIRESLKNINLFI